ncbi:MAG: hypothetical protein ACI8T1_002292 [Verrucomicrobiales bacterium]|jgi:hypothetical protein
MVWRSFLALFLVVSARADTADSVAAAFFEKEVRPLLISRCYECHAVGDGFEVKGGLRLDHRAGWEKGGESGPALVPGKVAESRLIQAVHYRDPDLQMPPKKKLDAAEIVVLERWIADGAYDPRDEALPFEAASKKAIDVEEERQFWAFQAPEDPAVPHPQRAGWANAPLDAFLLEHWETRDAAPAPEASSNKWMRRLAFALTGLPPAVLEMPEEEMDRPDARSRMVDRLLASPRYGERWGRHWLDVARYADSNGMDENMAYVEAYRYRDYVIDAFNADLPFDRFVTEQLAGDLLDDSKMSHKVATGFLSIGPKMLACDDQEKMRMDIVDEQIDTTGRAFLGLTFGCARCHDHKFDPISIEDYYGLAGIFRSTKTLINYKVVAKWHEYDFTSLEVSAAHEKIEALRKQADDKKADEETRKAARAEMKALIKATPPKVKVMGVTEDEVGDVRVHLRGSYQTLGEETERHVPVIFRESDSLKAPDDQSGRLELARWIASSSNPLTARVFVNRLWRWHFGKGLVASTENFGKLGSAPKHQALLDHLALELIRGDWSVKRLQRLITTSASYGMSHANESYDPDKELPAHQPRQRLDAESLRDSLLGLRGSLDLTMHGQLSKDQSGKYVNRSNLDGYLEMPRRAVYMPIVRSALYDAFVAFDMADPSTPNGDRRASVVAPQALYLMNSAQVHDASLAMAQALPDGNTHERLAILYHKLYHRQVIEAEVVRAQAFIETYSQAEAWAALVRVLLASNEFLYVD